MTYRRYRAVLLLWLALADTAASAPQVLFIQGEVGSSTKAGQLATATDFYSLELLSIRATDLPAVRDWVSRVSAGHGCVVISSSVLRSQGIEQLLRLLAASESPVPLLVVDAAPESDLGPLVEAMDLPIGCAVAPAPMELDGYDVAERSEYAFELAGVSIASPGRSGRYVLAEVHPGDYEAVMTISSSDGAAHPVFVRVAGGRTPVFVATASVPGPQTLLEATPCADGGLLDALPLLMFLRYSLGEGCWRPDARYANLTIDDPYLVEPYGNLRIGVLLAEMKRVGFHTTIAFTPFNYQRNDPDVVRMFLSNGEYFSLCVHGNNHDGQEFGPLSRRPLSDQERDVRQALARMDALSRSTTLKYDKVMVFPHSIAPKETLSVLAAYGFVATFNAVNLPLGQTRECGLAAQFRNPTTEYTGFPSYSRHGLSRSYSYDSFVDLDMLRTAIAEDLFLGNPLLFYTHQDFFAQSMQAFNPIAQLVNSMCPDVRWVSLGQIASHGYLKRIAEDGQHEILAFTDTLHISNDGSQPITYLVRRGMAGVGQVTEVSLANGEQLDYEIREGALQFQVRVLPGEEREVRISQGRAMVPQGTDISTHELSVVMARWASDFRDLVLSRSGWGRGFSRLFYLRRKAVILLGASLAAILGFALTVLGSAWPRRREAPGCGAQTSTR